MRKIKLMPDYQCFPLWEASQDIVGNIDPQDLPISSSLKKRLLSWAAKFDATLNINDPAISGFESEKTANEFRQDGDAIARNLQDELGADYIIKNGTDSVTSVAQNRGGLKSKVQHLATNHRF